MVDNKRIAFHPAVELSYLNRVEQGQVMDCMVKYQVKPSLAQAIQMKKAGQEGTLSIEEMERILNKIQKEPSKTNPKTNDFTRFFPDNYTSGQMVLMSSEIPSKQSK